MVYQVGESINTSENKWRWREVMYFRESKDMVGEMSGENISEKTERW